MGERITRREFVRRSGLIAAVGVTAPSVLAACAQTGQDGDEAEQILLDRAREQGFIRVGFANEAPYGYATEAGAVTGESPEVARVILERMDIAEIDGVVTEFGSLIAGLNAGRFDIVAAGMFITPERCEQVLFSDPDYCAPQAFAVKAGNPMGLGDYEDLAESDARFGALSGAVEVGYAADTGYSEDRIEKFPDTKAMIDALSADRVDVVALTAPTITWLVETSGNPNIEATEPFVPVIDGEQKFGCGGFAFRQENQEFRDEFNSVLNEMQENGEVLPIMEENDLVQYGFNEEAVQLAKEKSADELCEA